MTLEVYDKKYKKIGTVDLSEKVFNAKWNPDLIHQVLVAQVSNRRQPLASTKDRSEVRGGGRKPWQQKGLGRARHGSIRSPIWIGGGVTFGPRPERKFLKKVNKKMKRVAFHSVLSKKMKDKEITVIDKFDLSDYKTKNLAAIFKIFFKERPSILVVTTKGNKNIFAAGRNLVKTKISSTDSLNVYDCLRFKQLFFEKDAIQQIT